MIITRHSGFPYLDNAILDGTQDLEVDLNNFYVAFNGNVDDSNLSATANLDGSKVAAESVPSAKLVGASVDGSKIKPDDLDNPKMAAGAVTASIMLPGIATESGVDGSNKTDPTTSVSVAATAGATTWTELQRAAVLTGPNPTKVLVLFSCTLNIVDIGSGDPFQFRLLRGSSSNVLFESETMDVGSYIAAFGNFHVLPLNFVFLEDSAPGDASAEYIIEAKMSLPIPSGGMVFINPEIVLINTRR